MEGFPSTTAPSPDPDTFPKTCLILNRNLSRGSGIVSEFGICRRLARSVGGLCRRDRYTAAGVVVLAPRRVCISREGGRL